MSDHDELADQLEEANLYLSRIATAVERTRTASLVTAWAVGTLAAIALLSAIVTVIVLIVGAGETDGWR